MLVLASISYGFRGLDGTLIVLTSLLVALQDHLAVILACIIDLLDVIGHLGRLIQFLLDDRIGVVVKDFAMPDSDGTLCWSRRAFVSHD